MTNFTILIKASATRLFHLAFAVVFLPSASVAQWSLNIGLAAEMNQLNQLNAIIDRNNHMNVPVATAAIPHFNLLAGHSVAMEKDLKRIQFGFHYNRLKQTVGNNAEFPTKPQTALSYMNTQIGISGEWKLASFLGIGGALNYNFLNINRNSKTEPNYYTESNNLLAKGFGSYRYHLHFQKMLNPYFALSFRPYYQQSFKMVDFTRVNNALEKIGTPISTVKEMPPFDVAPQRWKNWGGEILLRMFLSCKK
jgi:hypothetical protein